MRWTSLQIPSQDRADGLPVPAQPLRNVCVCLGKASALPGVPKMPLTLRKYTLWGKDRDFGCGRVAFGAHRGLLYVRLSEPQHPELGASVNRQSGMPVEVQGFSGSGCFSLSCTGQDHVDFGQPEPHTVLFHEPGSFSVWVGGRGKVYLFNFPEGKNASVRTVSLGLLCPPLPFPHPRLLVLVRALREREGAGTSFYIGPSISITSHTVPGGSFCR